MNVFEALLEALDALDSHAPECAASEWFQYLDDLVNQIFRASLLKENLASLLDESSCKQGWPRRCLRSAPRGKAAG